MEKKSKKIFFLLIIFFLFFSLFFPIFSFAQCRIGVNCRPDERVEACCPGGANNPERGIVPCGSPCCPCQLSDFCVLIERILDFILFRLTPVVAILFLVIGGGLFLVSSGNPQTITTARRIITSVFIGLAVIYGGYFFVGLILQSIGLADWTRDIYHTWWEQGFFELRCGR